VREAVFLSFDRLLLLERGEVVYSGPPHAAAPFFEAEGFPCPAGANPADWIFEVRGAANRPGGDRKRKTKIYFESATYPTEATAFLLIERDMPWRIRRQK
jgi:ABC-type multidrug transport system ATPase subunit